VTSVCPAGIILGLYTLYVDPTSHSDTSTTPTGPAFEHVCSHQSFSVRARLGPDCADWALASYDGVTHTSRVAFPTTYSPTSTLTDKKRDEKTLPDTRQRDIRETLFEGRYFPAVPLASMSRFDSRDRTRTQHTEPNFIHTDGRSSLGRQATDQSSHTVNPAYAHTG
jgi:hypothetical protein